MIAPSMQEIKDTFNLEEERAYVNIEKFLGYLDLDSYTGKSIIDVKADMQIDLSQYPDDAFLEIDHYGHDGGFDIVIRKKDTRSETDKEVVERLQRQEYIRLKKEENLIKARDLLKANGEIQDGKD